MAQPSNIFQAHFEQSSPPYDDFSIINNLRRTVAPKQTLLAHASLNINEYLADQEDITPEDVRQRWDGGLSLVSWDSAKLEDPIGQLTTVVKSGHLQVSWKEVIFDIVKYTFSEDTPFRPVRQYYVFVFEGETDLVGRNFIRDIWSWDDRHATAHHAMLVYDGSWKTDSSLSGSIRGATWEDLVLDGEMIDRLKRDVKTFFVSKKLYQELDVPWKRGLLLIGPPGNGKSHTIKILVNESRVPCLYVKSIAAGRNDASEDVIMTIFNKARVFSPCLLVLEDLDSLIGEGSRAYFLNEVDGFANKNDGILILASTNHPERIDSAILNRPSRFDSNYLFEPPTPMLRREYATKWLAKVVGHNINGDSIQFQDQKVLAEKIANDTEGFSYAYMKELFLSFLLSVAHVGSSGRIPNHEALLLEQAVLLKKQIKMANEAEEKKDRASSTQKSTKSRTVPFFRKFFR